MTQKFDASTWTGLSSDGRAPDVREAQRPENAAQHDLPERTFGWRMFNGASFLQVAAILAAMVFVSSDWSSGEVIALVVLVIGGFVVVSLAMHFWSLRRNEGLALRLSERGLELPTSYAELIPWRHIGWVEQHLWRGFRVVSVQIDPQLELRALPPWPLSLLGVGSVKSKGFPVTLSCWAMKSDCDALMGELRLYRDTYCQARLEDT